MHAFKACFAPLRVLISPHLFFILYYHVVVVAHHSTVPALDPTIYCILNCVFFVTFFPPKVDRIVSALRSSFLRHGKTDSGKSFQ